MLSQSRWKYGPRVLLIGLLGLSTLAPAGADDLDRFFAAPLGEPGNPHKYTYIGPMEEGRDPGKVDWSAFGAASAEEKRRLMVEYAQGRLKVGPEFGGIDASSDRPGAAPSPSPAPAGNRAGSDLGPPTTEENGTKAWINTIKNPHVAPRSRYRGSVMAAIKAVVDAGIGMEAPGSVTIANYDTYHAAVVERLRHAGFLALHDGEELAICKPGDEGNEQWDISTSKMLVRTFYAAYVVPPGPELGAGAPPASDGGKPTPEPAPGKVPAQPVPSDGFLPPSPLLGDIPGQKALCNTIQNPTIAPKSQYRSDIHKAIDLVIAAGTGLKEPGSNELADIDLYHKAVVSELRKMGYCAAHDGEELAIKRPGDDFNEQWDISTASGLVRRFYAAWISPPSVGE